MGKKNNCGLKLLRKLRTLIEWPSTHLKSMGWDPFVFLSLLILWIRFAVVGRWSGRDADGGAGPPGAAERFDQREPGDAARVDPWPVADTGARGRDGEAPWPGAAVAADEPSQRGQREEVDRHDEGAWHSPAGELRLRWDLVLRRDYIPITYFWTVPLILDHYSPLISCWELDKFKNCWKKSFRTSKILTLLYQQFSNLLISQRDMSGPRLGTLSNNRWSGGTREWPISLPMSHAKA